MLVSAWNPPIFHPIIAPTLQNLVLMTNMTLLKWSFKHWLMETRHILHANVLTWKTCSGLIVWSTFTPDLICLTWDAFLDRKPFQMCWRMCAGGDKSSSCSRRHDPREPKSSTLNEKSDHWGWVAWIPRCFPPFIVQSWHKKPPPRLLVTLPRPDQDVSRHHSRYGVLAVFPVAPAPSWRARVQLPPVKSKQTGRQIGSLLLDDALDYKPIMAKCAMGKLHYKALARQTSQ